MDSFDLRNSLIVVSATVYGPADHRTVRLALDTGATWTVISRGVLDLIGYDLAAVTRRVRIVTADGLRDVPMLRVSLFSALGRERRNFYLLGHSVPPTSGVDGLLSLDFLRGMRLAIDFRLGEITLE